MEKEYRVSWLKVAIVIALIVLLVVIIFLFYPKKSNKQSVSTTYINNLNAMKEVGFEYFKGENLPTEVGEARRLSLENMVASRLLVEFLDEEGKTCNKEESYIEATKINKNEYELKVYLSCKNKTDYIVTSIKKEEVTCTNCNNTSSEIKDNTNKKPTTNTTVNKKPTNNQTVNQVTNNNCNGTCNYSRYYTVYYDFDNGSSIVKELVKEGNIAPYKTATKDGYTFVGWYLNNNAFNFNTKITKSITLKAKWQKNTTNVNNYTVSFDSNGGSYVNSQVVASGKTATKPSNPTRSCYIFDGWTLNGNDYNFNSKVTKNITLKANWIYDDSCNTKTYTVKFNSNGGTRVRSQVVEEGDYAYYPSEPTRDGYTFVGWYYNNREFNFNKAIYKNYTLEARWEEDYSNYSTYCKIEKERIYSTGYTSEDSLRNKSYETYNYTIKYLKYTPYVRVISYGATPSSEYQASYNYWKSPYKSIYMSSNTSYDVDSGGYYNLNRHSLTSNNLSPIVRVGSKQNGYYTFDITLNLYNLRNIYNTSFYASNLRSYVYFMPIYFDVEYVDTTNCFEDKTSKSYLYDDYYMY